MLDLFLYCLLNSFPSGSTTVFVYHFQEKQYKTTNKETKTNMIMYRWRPNTPLFIIVLGFTFTS